MSEEDRLKLENKLLLTKSKAQMINLYLDLQQKVEKLENIRKEAIEECKSVIGNPEHTIVGKNELMKIMLTILNKGSDKE